MLVKRRENDDVDFIPSSTPFLHVVIMSYNTHTHKNMHTAHLLIKYAMNSGVLMVASKNDQEREREKEQQ